MLRALLLSLLALLVAAPVAAQTAPQRFIGPEVTLPADDLEPGWRPSLATRGYVWRRSGVAVEALLGVPLEVTVRCLPNPYTNSYAACRVARLRGVSVAQEAALVAVIDRYLDAGSFRVSLAATQALLAQDSAAAIITMPLLVDDFQPLTNGVPERPVTMAEAITGSRFGQRMSDNYPPRALRSGWQGRLEMDCVIYSDRSVGCEALSFDPPEQFAFFRDLAERQSTRILMPETLADGTPSAGARFPVTMDYALD